MYIVTDTFNGGEYTPQLVDTIEEAKIILNNRMATYIRNWKKDEYEFIQTLSDDEVIKWAENNILLKMEGNTIIEGIIINFYGAVIYYNDAEKSYNMVNIHHADKNITYELPF